MEKIAANYLPNPQALRKYLSDGVEMSITTGATCTGYNVGKLNLRHCLVALQRVLFSITPIAAESNWWLRGAFTAQHLGRWIEHRSPGFPPTYTFNDGVSGRHTLTLPAGVAADDVVVISEPSPLPTPLRDFFCQLVEQFSDEYPDDQPWKETLRERVKRLDVMYGPDYEKASFLLELREIRPAKTTTNVAWPSNEVLDDMSARIVKGYANFQVTGILAGDLILVATVLRHAMSYRYTFHPGFSVGSLLTVMSLESFLTGLIRSSSVPGEILKLIRNASESMQLKGDETQESALTAQELGLFYGHIFASMSWFWGALRGFKFLTFVEPGVKSDSIALNVCDERIAIAEASLASHFADSLDRRDLLSRRDHIAQLRKESGDPAADQLADQYLEMEMLYPSYFKQFLLGQTDKISWIRPE
jgi:hypothetical protein